MIEAVKKGLITCPVYLSIGQESISATISELTKDWAVFAQHRCHSVYLAHGGDPVALIDELLDRETGCNRGRGGSPCIQDLSIPMFGHHGLIGENIPLATGYALATGKPTVVYFGDAAAEEDYALASFGFAATHKLPILYVCEDNGLSILTPIKDRRSWHMCNIVRAFGIAVDDDEVCLDFNSSYSTGIEDQHSDIYRRVSFLIDRLPAYINISTERHMWHAGISSDGPPKVDRLAEMKEHIKNADKIERQIKNKVEKLWQKQLRKR